MPNNQKIDNGVLPAFITETEVQGDGSHRQVVKVGEIAATALNIPSAVTQGSAAVVTPGTAVVLGAALATKKIIVSALAANAQVVTIGDSGVTTSTGLVLFPGAMITIEIDDRSKIYVNSSATATVQYTAFS